MEFQADEKYERLLLNTLIHIQMHLGGDLALETLAEQAGFSPYHFHRIFREVVGEPLRQHVRRLRLEQGAYRLKISEASILRIALDVGYGSHEAFSRAFKQQFGLTPTAFRDNFLHTGARNRPDATRGTPLARQGAATAVRELPPVRLERVRPLLVAFIRHTGPYEAVLEPGSPLAFLWDALFAWAGRQKLLRDDSLLLGIPQDDPTVTPPEWQRFDVGLHVPFFRQPEGNVGLQTLAPGLYAVGRHYGAFEGLEGTYAHIYQSVVAPGDYRLRPAPPFEVYAHTRVKEGLLVHYTDVYMPVEATGPLKNGG